MRSLNVSILAVALLASIAWADTTWVAENIEGGVWNLEGSPYIISQNTIFSTGEVLTIDPGVQVLFAPFIPLVVQSSTIIANGTEEDSIYFYPLDPDQGWGNIMVVGFGAHSEFAFCHFIYGGFGYFDNTGALTISYDDNLIIHHCTFESCFDGLRPVSVQRGIIKYCFFKNIGFRAIQTVGAVEISNCVFLSDGEWADTAVDIPGYLRNCVFINSIAAFGTTGIIYNSIFSHARIISGSIRPGIPNNCDVNHNIFFGFDDISAKYS